MIIDEVRNMAISFRKAIISLKQLPEIKGHFFEKFPHGACGTTCDLFMYYLSKKGIESEYYNGTFKFKTINSIHGWVGFGDFYIDLTADQFNIIGDLEFPGIIFDNKEKYPLLPYLENINNGVGVKGELVYFRYEYDLIVDVIENGYSEERIIKKIFNFD